MGRNEETGTSKIRVSLDLSPSFFERLQALEDLTQESKSGVIRQALQLYEYVVQKTTEGYSFKAVNPQGKEESLVFFGSFVPAAKKPEAVEEEVLV
jgi:hypothetical protein